MDQAMPVKIAGKSSFFIPCCRNNAENLIELPKADQTFACCINVFTNAPCCGSFATV